MSVRTLKSIAQVRIAAKKLEAEFSSGNKTASKSRYSDTTEVEHDDLDLMQAINELIAEADQLEALRELESNNSFAIVDKELSEKAFINTLFDFDSYADKFISDSFGVGEAEPDENINKGNVDWDVSKYTRKGLADTTLEIDI
jgi:hypothetical protein